jgi:N-acetyl-1-D-myo-inositol-2-amino-2-deoxy-alpha-D-glucopyranoside deacetylase
VHNDDPGFRFVLVHATDGEGDSIVEASGATSETLGAVRREEDRQGVADARPCPGPARVVGYSDGGLADVPRRELVDRIAAILDQERPEVVVTFGPDGITGHLDHITIGEATPRRSCGWQGTAGQACGGSSTAGSDSW